MIYKINEYLSTTQKLSLLNDMVIELYGLISKAKFDKNELDQIFGDLGSATIFRKFFRNQSLGHTLETYTEWTHLKAESGYSIWKIFPAGYSYDSLNELYCDNKVFENRGEANSESDDAFDKVYLYNGSEYIDNTSEAATEEGTEFELMDDTDEYLYVGLSSTFAGVSFEFQTRGSNYSLSAEYYNGSVWTDLEISGQTFEDNTSNFESNGRIYWDIPDNWATTSVNGQTKYWVRFSTSETPVTTAKAYQIIPANSVASLLKLSSSEIFDEDWAWCSYNNAIYITIRNSGVTTYEGDYYITSSSSEINKQNYFISNHHFTTNYKNAQY